MDGDDVGMVEGAGRSGFLQESAIAFAVGDAVRRQDLDRHRARELGVARSEHDAHTAFAKLRFDDVAAEGLTVIEPRAEAS
jgi:hypothetical protein